MRFSLFCLVAALAESGCAPTPASASPEAAPMSAPSSAAAPQTVPTVQSMVRMAEDMEVRAARLEAVVREIRARGL